MLRYTPTAADYADADATFGGNADQGPTPDYIAQHPVSAPTPLQPKCGRPPVRLIRLITDGDPSAPLLCRNSQGINNPFPHGITLLHIACHLYAHHRARLSPRAGFYERVAAALIEAGADPLAEMRTASGDIETPASVCRGFMPPSMRARMLAEAASGRLDEGGAPDFHRSIIDRRAGRKQRASAKPREHCLRDAGTAWLILDRAGDVVGMVPYTGRTRATARQLAYRQRRRLAA